MLFSHRQVIWSNSLLSITACQDKNDLFEQADFLELLEQGQLKTTYEALQKDIDFICVVYPKYVDWEPCWRTLMKHCWSYRILLDDLEEQHSCFIISDSSNTAAGSTWCHIEIQHAHICVRRWKLIWIHLYINNFILILWQNLAFNPCSCF